MANTYQEVHKFGGSSIANADRIKHIATLLPQKTLVVVSAMAGVTQSLVAVMSSAINQEDWNSIMDDIFILHENTINSLLATTHAKDLIIAIKDECERIKTMLQGIAWAKSYSAAQYAEVISFGEVCAARIVSAYLQLQHSSVWLDATSFLTIDESHDILTCDWQQSQKAWDQLVVEKIATIDKIDKIVITGFRARTAQGCVTTLGLNGSDISASLIAELADANKLYIWTDQNGIYSADPNLVRTAFPISHMSYEEALELAYFGTTIIHPKMIGPAKRSHRPIYIKNSYAIDNPGTIIDDKSPPCPYAVRGLSSIDLVSMITIEGTGLMGVCGVAARSFNCMREQAISVILISQASSEHSICFCVRTHEGMRAQAALQQVFRYEISQKEVNSIVVRDDCAIVAVIGESMVGRLGIAGRMCYSLANAQVNIIAIAQGSSERNISVVINNKDVMRALRSLHSGFYLANKTVALAVIGTGVVATAFLDQLAEASRQLMQSDGITICVRAIVNSRKMLLSDGCINLQTWKDQLQQTEKSSDLSEMLLHFSHDEFPHCAIVDCTANADIAADYVDFIKRGFHIITPNKKAGSGDFDYYREIHHVAKKCHKHFLYETTVCAGLPVINTLQDILRTGDKIISIKGVVSGSLSYIFNSMSNKSMSFSQAVISAKEQGYTEPDPRDDLSGRDVVRKMVCLAREMGYEASIDQVQAINLVPDNLMDCSLDEFLQQLPSHDDGFAKNIKEKFRKACIAYVGHINQNGDIVVSMQEYNSDHPFAKLSGTDNMLIFKTKRYNKQPLVVQGPGAGADVTAAGVFADLLRLATYVND